MSVRSYHFIFLLGAVLLILLSGSCSQKSTNPTGNIIFPDANLEQTIRDCINKPEADISISDVNKIRVFWAESRPARRIYFT